MTIADTDYKSNKKFYTDISGKREVMDEKTPYVYIHTSNSLKIVTVLVVIHRHME